MGCCNDSAELIDPYTRSNQESINKLRPISRIGLNKPANVEFTEEQMAEMTQLMMDHNIKIEAPIKREEKNAKIYFIRHGLSMHNFRCLEAETKFGKDSAE